MKELSNLHYKEDIDTLKKQVSKLEQLIEHSNNELGHAKKKNSDINRNLEEGMSCLSLLLFNPYNMQYSQVGDSNFDLEYVGKTSKAA
jgi:serine/threonine protein phosphatase PrpC